MAPPYRGTAATARQGYFGSTFGALAEHSPQASPAYTHASAGPPPSPMRSFVLPPSSPACFSTLTAEVPHFPGTMRPSGQGEGVLDLLRRSPVASPTSVASAETPGGFELLPRGHYVSLSRRTTTDTEETENPPFLQPRTLSSAASSPSSTSVQGYVSLRQRSSSGSVFADTVHASSSSSSARQHEMDGRSAPSATVQGYVVDSGQNYRPRSNSAHEPNVFARTVPAATTIMWTQTQPAAGYSQPGTPMPGSAANVQSWRAVQPVVRMVPQPLNPAYMTMGAETGSVPMQSRSPQLRPSTPVLMPSSPAWTTVDKQPKRRGAKSLDDVPALPDDALGGPPSPPCEAPLTRLRTTGESVDLYYEKKELFVKGWSREDKATRSVKGKKRVDYQVEKRKQQSARDRGIAIEEGGESDAD